MFMDFITKPTSCSSCRVGKFFLPTLSLNGGQETDPAHPTFCDEKGHWGVKVFLVGFSQLELLASE